jgi:hypothetical protein
MTSGTTARRVHLGWFSLILYLFPALFLYYVGALLLWLCVSFYTEHGPRIVSDGPIALIGAVVTLALGIAAHWKLMTDLRYHCIETQFEPAESFARIASAVAKEGWSIDQQFKGRYLRCRTSAFFFPAPVLISIVCSRGAVKVCSYANPAWPSLFSSKSRIINVVRAAVI